MRDCSTRMEQIRRQISRYRGRCEKRILACLSAASLALCAGIGILFRLKQQPGKFTIQTGYGSVLLHNGGDAYIVIAVIAFIAGSALTILGIGLTQRKRAALRR